MTSSPTPAVLPDARALARKIIAQSWADRGFPDSADRIASEDVWVADAMLKFAEQLSAIPPASDAAVPAGELDWRQLFDAMSEAAGRLKGAIRPQLDAIPYADLPEVRRAFNDIAVVCGRGVDLSRALSPAPKVASDTGAAEVERIARAICEADGLDPDEDIVGGQASGFENYGPLWQAEERSEGQLGLTNYVRLARAAYSAAAPKVASDTGAITPEWCLRMADLEAGQEIGAGSLDHPLRTKCELPPAGWVCTREPGHDGPCAAVAGGTGAGLREALEEARRGLLVVRDESDEDRMRSWAARHLSKIDAVLATPTAPGGEQIAENAKSLVGIDPMTFERAKAHVAAMAIVNADPIAALTALATLTDATDGATGGGEVQGTFACPICGDDKPHHHTPAVVDAYQTKGSRK